MRAAPSVRLTQLQQREQIIVPVRVFDNVFVATDQIGRERVAAFVALEFVLRAAVLHLDIWLQQLARARQPEEPLICPCRPAGHPSPIHQSECPIRGEL